MIRDCVPHQVHHPGASEPDRDEEGEELGESDGGGGLEDVEVLEDVRDTHQSHGPQEPQPDPGAVQVDRDKGWRNSEVIHEGIKLQHEPELVRCGDKLKRKRRIKWKIN